MDRRVCVTCGTIVLIPYADRQYVEHTLRVAQSKGVAVDAYTCLACRGGARWEIFNTGPLAEKE